MIQKLRDIENINNTLSLISKKKEEYREEKIRFDERSNTATLLGHEFESKVIDIKKLWVREIINLLDEIEQKLKEQDHE